MWMVTYGLHEHEALRVGDDLGCVEGLLEVVEDLLLVAAEPGLGAVELLAGTATLALQRGQTSSEDSLANERHGLAHVQRVDRSPLAGTLLACGIEDLLDEGSAVLIVVVEDVAGDLDEEGVEHALVPLSKGVAHLLAAHAKTALHHVVGLAGVRICLVVRRPLAGLPQR